MDELKRMDRRQAIKWMLAGTATFSLLQTRGWSMERAVSGYGRDPNLMEVHKPGDFWPLTFTAEQYRTVAALCDVILPADERSPSASQLKVQDFIDEWISAPYEPQQQHREIVLKGLVWLDEESKKRFRRPFVELNVKEKTSICDDICSVQKAANHLKSAAGFFQLFRNLTMSGFYTTPEGMKDIQYVGNVPLTKFDGPPPEVLAYLKLG